MHRARSYSCAAAAGAGALLPRLLLVVCEVDEQQWSL
jgi:hypothetical protein